MNVLDLFSGIGGFSLGLERAGMRTVAFCEIDAHARKVLNKRWPGIPVFTDVTALTKEQINEQIDVLAGGFPCQDISTAGRGAGLSGSRSGLWFEFHRLIKEIQPRYAIIENVSALRSRGLDVVLRGLAEIGYDAEWHCIPASAVGAPHRRDRIWIVAYPRGQRRASLRGKCPTATGKGFGWADDGAGSGSDAEREESLRSAREDTGALANAPGIGLPGQRQLVEPVYPTPLVNGQAIKSTYGRVASQWAVEPDVGRVAHGIPNRVDRLKQLGNAVVPQIPELIGRAIMEHERVRSLA